MNKKKVLVVFGSMSSEHEISCLSAYNIVVNLDNKKYRVDKIGIDKNGVWFRYKGNNAHLKDNTWLNDNENKDKVYDLIAELKKYDVVFPVLHGKYGEDGTIQGLFELAQVKYVGCNVLASSIGMDKAICKKIVSLEDILIVDYIEVNKFDLKNILTSKRKLESLDNEIKFRLNYPVIIKPNSEGSSYGIVKVDANDKLLESLKFAFRYDDKILIEKYVDNRQEIECAVIQDEDKVYASTPGEISSANEIYDYDAKYKNNDSSIIIPAQISDDMIETVRQISTKIFKLLNFSGLARIDFFLSNGQLYFNEVNTLPGFTNISMYPQMLMHDKIEYSQILDILINTAIE
ncbi:MAG: D-alanine--D-alanine ligase family protein, partial [Clostridia bacterium]